LFTCLASLLAPCKPALRAPYTQRFARGSGQNWHFVSLACQENFKHWREGDGPREEAKPGGRINHTHTKVCLAASETRGFTFHIPVCVWAPLKEEHKKQNTHNKRKIQSHNSPPQIHIQSQNRVPIPVPPFLILSSNLHLRLPTVLSSA
jgi:hypothetical protein